MEQFDRLAATFRPHRTDDLTPGAASCVGVTAEWEAAWIIEDGPYAGQWAMRLAGGIHWPIYWVPECDLAPVMQG